MAVRLRWTDCLPYICLLFSSFSIVSYSVCVWPTALYLSRITNFDILFLVMGFICFVGEIQFMLISSHHICIRAISRGVLICKFKKIDRAFE